MEAINEYQSIIKEINVEANRIVLGSEQLVEQLQSQLTSLFENINLTSDKYTNKKQYFYPIQPLTAESIFPTKEKTSDIEKQKKVLLQDFVQSLAKIPHSHKENLALWLDHFDTALQCFFSSLPSVYTAEISQYDHLKTTVAIATALVLSDEQNKAKPFLLIQGDFFGIQDFIFSGGRETNKRAAKILRGRSFQVSLFTELAALKVLEACELPSTSQLMNAAGKFLIVAPNTEKIRQAIYRVQNELNQWFVDNTYGLVGLGLAVKEAAVSDFFGQTFKKLRDSLFKELEKIKLQRLDLTATTVSVQNIKYPFGECQYNSYFPAEDSDKQQSIISADQIKIGEYLAKKARIIICNKDAEIYQDRETTKLSLSIFSYHIIFTSIEEITGRFGKQAQAQQIKRLWDFELPQNTSSSLWNGYARRYINAYIPYFIVDGEADIKKYKIVYKDNISYEKDKIKTFDYLACEDREKDGMGNYIGQAALMTLKGDVDNLGLIFQKGLKQPNFAKMAALSRQMNQFFSLWLPAYCVEHQQNMYTVFAGGDDFFLIGPWYSTQKLAFAMQQNFARYVANNPEIHFSSGMVMTKVGTPVHRLGEMAEEALEKAKKVDGKNAVTIYQTSVGWNKWETLSTLELKIEELAKKYNISTSYLYSLIYFAKQAQNKENNLENTMWRSRFYYRTVRYVVDKLKKEERETALKEITQLLGEQGIETHKMQFIIPLFNYFYKLRNN
ncbi:type III-A CRISPR-associated protein Cas10/Csm1 [Gallibacterium anatis]|uniref:type III-A CRISPR-associated protein Cas10/Csm1 n=1 Tax=Gallibacterium anatis TaxID=750 RepID=UPI000A66740B|nr:type III-A CRISPR-associated protein Cas10/Csm1 [Gallibacterium anatis]